jgi:fibronectin-binding autotransporter adhesin
MKTSSFIRSTSNALGKTVLLFALGRLLAISVASAGTVYWDPDTDITSNDITTGTALGGNGTWDTATLNWFDGISNEVAWTNSNNDDAIFSGTAGFVNLGEDISARSVLFTNVGGSYTISGNTLTLGTGATVDTGGGNHTIDSVIAGNAGLIKAGAGTLTLTTDNTYSGATTISGGTLIPGTDERIPNGSAVSVSAGATLDLGNISETIGSLAGAGVVNFNNSLVTGGNNTSTTFSGTGGLNGSGTLTKTGTGILTISGDNSATYSGKIVITNGTIAINNNNRLGTAVTDSTKVTLNGGTLRGTATFTLASTRGIVLGANGATLEQSSGGTMTVAGIITGGRFTKIGTGTVLLNANNTFSGGITISNGTVTHNGEFSGASGSPSTSGTIPATAVANYIILNGTNCVLAGNRTGSGATWLANNKGITLNGGGTLDDITDGTAVHIYSGVIGGSGPLMKTGGGILALAGVNTYSGATIITNGTLRVRSSSNRLPQTTQVLVLGTGTLDPGSTGGNIQNIHSINGDGNVTFSAGSTLSINANTPTNSTLTGIISDGSSSGRITKNGTATLTLGGLNTYKGQFTNNAGTTIVSPGGALCGPVCDVVVNGGTVILSNATQSVENLGGAGGTLNLAAAGHIFTINSVNASATSTFTGNIIGAGTITKMGTNAEIFLGTNSYSGGTIVSEGILQGTTSGLQGSITNNSAVVFNQTTTGTYAGILSGPGTLAKNGSGTVTLTGANTCTGTTTVSNGTLFVNGNIASTSVTVTSGAKLGGTGTVEGTVTINGGGTISAGTNAGILTVNNGLNLASGGTNLWELSGNSTITAGTDFDQIALSGGNLGLGGSSRLLIKFIGSSTTPTNTDIFWQSAQSWKIISLSGGAANPGSTTFAGIDGTNGITAGIFSTSVDGGGNVFLNFTPSATVPQPVLSSTIVGAGTTSAQVTWSSVNGANYRVEYKTNLNQVGWLTLTNISATSTNTTAIDNTAPVPNERYYRVVAP